MFRVQHQSHRCAAVLAIVASIAATVTIELMFVPAQSVQAHAHAPAQAPLPTLDPTQFPTDGTPEPPSPSPGPSPSPSPQPPAPSPIQQIIRYFFQVFFPANTFREAIEGAARAIFNAEIEALAQPMREVLNTVMFAGESVSGNVPLPGQFTSVVDLMTKAAVPIWGLSLALMALAVLTRQAVGLGYGSNEVAGEAARWFLIALASGNGYTLVTLVHNGIGALTRAIAAGSGLDAGRIISALLFDGSPPDISIVILILIAIIGIITIIVMAVTYVARYALMVGLAALGPLAIACEGIPFTRFVFRDWLSMFLKVELLQVLNVAVLRIFADLGLSQWGVFVEGTGGYLIKLVVMVGLASAIIGLNTSIFKQVFATAIEVAQQMRQATEQLVGALMAVAGVAATATTGMPIAALGGLAGSGAGVSTLSSGNTGLNTSSNTPDNSSTSSFGTSAGSGEAPTSDRTDVSSNGKADPPMADANSSQSKLSGRRASYRASKHEDSQMESVPAAETDKSSERVSHRAADGANEAEAGPLKQSKQSPADGTSDLDVSSQRPQAVEPLQRNGRMPNAERDTSSSNDSAEPPPSRMRLHDTRQTASELGAYARAISIGSRMDGVAGAAMRGFGVGTSVGDQVHRQRAASDDPANGQSGNADYLQRLQGQQGYAAEARADRLAYRLGANSAPDRQQIVDGLMSHGSQSATPSGYAPDEMRQAHMANQPLLRDMVSEYGSPARAAAVGGYSSFGAMANAMAMERLRSIGVEPKQPPSPEFAQFPPPVSTWAGSQPAETDETRMLPHDYGLGALVAGNLGSDPASAPEWARTMHSLRQAYPSNESSVFGEFLSRVQSGSFTDETAARSWLEQAVQERPPIAHDVRLWWRTEEHAGRAANSVKKSQPANAPEVRT